MKYQAFYQSIVQMLNRLSMAEIEQIMGSRRAFSSWFNTFAQNHKKVCQDSVDQTKLYSDLLSFFRRICPHCVLRTTIEDSKLAHAKEVVGAC